MYKKITSIAGSLVFLYGAGALVLSKFVSVPTTQSWWIQVLGCMVTGGLLFSVPHFNLNLKFFSKQKRDDYYSNVHHVDELAQSFRERNDTEGLEDCSKLHAMLFKRKYL